MVDGTPVQVTADMLDATSYDMATAGNYTVKGSYQGFEFEFAVTVQAVVVSSIQLETAPTTSTYGHRDNLTTLDVTGGKVKVNYNNGTFEELAKQVEIIIEKSEVNSL